MWNIKQVVVLALFLSAALISLNSHLLVYGQLDELNNNSNNNTQIEFTQNKNMSSDSLGNDTRIMENTSGMIDEEFGALKDTFKSLFGK